ncbi:hypothetical protein OEZ85_010849 [Tetradesmus obliquus]|uniref:Uncharacterized protein n=1 Tax=Tetradesmus obliquus TaxID=3088 RepID=A0ABY8TP68_TETOB|nr:hypothetical protein OEZ85_010849 [Tetradesmus obliquus]
MLRVFGPPEDRVRDIFHGAPGSTQDRKARELEKKRAYGAELQAQMQEKERQRQQERQQRLAPGNLPW